MNSNDYALICKALGDSNRLQIVSMLSDGEKCAHKLLEKFEISQPTLSHHCVNADWSLLEKTESGHIIL